MQFKDAYIAGANRELQQALKELNQSKIQSSLAQDEIKGTFDPLCAAYHGGVWERLVQEDALFSGDAASIRWRILAYCVLRGGVYFELSSSYPILRRFKQHWGTDPKPHSSAKS